MIDRWVERPVILNGGVYADQEATATFRVLGEDYLKIEEITIDGCMYSPVAVEKQIGVPAMVALVDEVEKWWDEEGYHDWMERRDDDEASEAVDYARENA